MNRFKWTSLALLFVTCFAFSLSAQTIKIGEVDVNRALNESIAGIRSKDQLEAESREKQKELQLKQEELQNLADEIKNNMLMTPETKNQKEEELRRKDQALRQESREFERQLRNRERQMTGEIIQELRTSIRTVARQEKLDLVVEKSFLDVILYMKYETTDLTNKVIDHYNSLKNASGTPK